MTSAEKATIRETAFLDLPERLTDKLGRLFGPEIRLFTPWHHHLLHGFDNPLVFGGKVTPEAIVEALWIMRPAYRPGSVVRWRFFRGWWLLKVRADFERYRAAIITHLLASKIDQPAFSVPIPANAPLPTGDDVPHFLASFEVLCRTRLGYTRAEVYHTPYAHTWQLLGIVLPVEQAKIARPPDCPRFRPRGESRKIGDHLRRRLAARG